MIDVLPLKRAPEKREALIRLWNEGYRTKAIAERVALPVQSVERYARILRRDYGVPLRHWSREG